MNFDSDVFINQINQYPDSQLTRFILDLLIDKINDHCRICENERMTCVLSPSCHQRFLLDLRIGGDADKKNIPNFCYQQSILNLKKYFEKKTNLYKPKDTYIYLADFIPLLFHGIEKPFLKSLKEWDYLKIHEIIRKSKVPGIPLKNGLEVLKNIALNEKLDKEGTFLYDGDVRFFVILKDGDLIVVDMNYEYVIVNMVETAINNIILLNLILKFILSENLFQFQINEFNSENLMVSITIPDINEKEFEKMFQTGKGGKTSDKDAASETLGDLIQSLERVSSNFNIVLTDANNVVFNFTVSPNYECRRRANQTPLTPKMLKKAAKTIAGIFCRKK